MKYLVVGLGNIGDEYRDTRHNIGFLMAEALVASCEGVAFVSKRYGSVAECRYKGRTLVVLKPSTYMNLSGKAVHYWMQKEGIPLENLMVLVDDLALPFGTVRLRSKGSDGGHNGLKDINQVLGAQDYARMRFGIGNEFLKGRQIDYVLGPFMEDERALLPERLTYTTDAVKSFATIGIERTMNFFNKK